MGSRSSGRRGSAAGRGRAAPLGAWIAGILVLASTSWVTSAAHAETITWTNPAGGSWGTATNWNPQDVPNETGEEAVIPAGQGVYAIDLSANCSLDRVLLNNADATLRLLTRSLTLGQPEGLVNLGTIVGGGAIHGFLDQGAGARLTAPAGAVLYLYGSANNAGAIEVGAVPVTGQGRLLVSTPGYPLDGPGEIVMHAESDANMARIDGNYGDLIQGATHTIRGAGTISVVLATAGRVIADQNGYTLLLNTGAKTNSGLFEAVNGGVLELSNITTTQTGAGAISADGGRVRVTNGTVSGGALSAANGGVIETAGSPTFTNVSLSGEFRAPAGSSPRVNGSATTNEGTIRVNPDGSSTDAVFTIAAPSHLLMGSGEVVLRTGGDPNDARIVSSYGSLIQDAGHTIRGEGSIQTGLTNHGLVVADVPGRELQLSTEAKSNDGTLEALGGILRVAIAVTQTGPGAILAQDGAVYLQANVTGGRLEASGTGYYETAASPVLSDVTLAGGQIRVPGGTSPRLSGTGTTNDGTILIHSDASAADAIVYILSSNNHQLAGNGQIVLQAAGDLNDAQLTHSYGSLVQGAQHTIRGTGRVLTGLTNEGLVNADVSGQVLQLDDQAKTNNALFEATGGGILRLASAVTQGPEGRIVAGGGDVEIQNNVTGGRIESTGGSVVRWQGSSVLSDVRNLSQLQVPAGGRTRLTGAATVNDGTILVNSDSSSVDAIVYVQSSNNHQLTGSGEIVLQAAGDVNDAQLWHNYGSLVQGAQHTIRGTGRVGVALTNEGMVKADVSGQTLQLDDQAKTSAGTLRAENGGLLNVNVALANTGLADAWSGGTFRTGVAPSNYAGGTLTGGRWEVHDNSTMRLFSTNVQHLNARVLLDGPNANLYRDDGTTPALGSLSTIEDNGEFELAGGRSFATGGNLTVNAGRLTIGSASTLTVNGTYNQSGNAEPGFDVTSVNGVLAATIGPVVIGGGRLIGSGSVQNDVQSSGWICPGTSAGELTINGSYTQNEAGTCYIELAGPNAGQYDHLQISGAATLAGRLIVQGVNGYVPAVGTQFTILNFASRTGTFGLETGSPGSGIEYTTQYYADRVVITITSAPSTVPEDEISDGSTDDPAPDDPGELDGTQEPDAGAGAVPEAFAFGARARVGGGAAIELALPWEAAVTIELFDFTGRRIAVVRDGTESPGTHAYPWGGIGDGGRRCPSGVYLARVRVAGPDRPIERCVRMLMIR